MSPRHVSTVSWWLAAQAMWGSYDAILHLVDMAGHGPVTTRQKARAALCWMGHGDLIGERRAGGRMA